MMGKNIYQVAIKCKEYSDKNIRYYNKPQNGYDFLCVNGATRDYEIYLLELYDCIKEKYPHIADQLKEHIREYDKNSVIHQVVIDTLVDLIIASENPFCKKRKIFISHSSIDFPIIEKFVDHILGLGIGINADDIFCSSIEGMDIKNGEDLRQHIQNNIRYADFSYLMISEHYKKSEICQNEMGAVWAYDSNVRIYMLPYTDVKEIGWLCNARKGDYLNNSIVLDEIKNELCEYYNLPDRGTTWSRQRELFLHSII